MLCNFLKVKIDKTVDNSATTDAGEKLAQICNPQHVKKLLVNIFPDLEAIKFYFIKVATDFQRQSNCLLGD